MADKKQRSSFRLVNRRINNLDTNMDNLYRSTYSTRIDNKNDMDRITSGIEDNLDDLLSTVNGQNVSDISTLLLRLQNKSGNKKYIDQLNSSIESLFNSEGQLMDGLNMENIHKQIKTENYQYDLMLKYLPKLNEALEIMKDNVLSSDNFTKDFINVMANKSNNDYINIFNSRAKKLKEKYKIQERFEEMYIEASKYGEYFLYHVPYNKAFQRLLQRKNATVQIQYESGNVTYNNSASTTVLFENSKECIREFEANGVASNLIKAMVEADKDRKINLFLDPYGIIPEFIEEIEQVAIENSNHISLTESYYLTEDGIDNGSNDWSRGKEPNKTIKYDTINIANDGFIGAGMFDQDNNIKMKKMTGSVMHKIDRENIQPVYIGEYCLGYLYFRFDRKSEQEAVILGNTYNSLTTTGKLLDTELDKQNDLFTSVLAARISDQINAKFINSNIDLKEEIYAILRYNDDVNMAKGTLNINVTFIPAEDVHHFYFKLNPKTHRGISDLERSIVPAMMYILLYLTDIIGKVSRSQDKRVYYVKQNIETNVSRTLLNVITQIKKGNMNMRQLQSLNTIFNTVGKYNDYVIPVGPSGDPPIQFEVMQGQNVETPTDLMDRQLEEAVNSTDVPYEFVQSVNQVDFATRFTMSNSKFLRKVFKRQYICQTHFTEIFRKAYNFEYNENETSMTIQLPAPAFLTMTNSQQLFDNTKQFVTAIVDTELTDNEELKPIVMKNLLRNYLGTYIDYDMIDGIVEKSKQELELEAVKKSANDDLGDLGSEL